MTRQLVVGRHSGKPAGPVHCFLFARIRVERDMLETAEHRPGASIGRQQRAYKAAANGSDAWIGCGKVFFVPNKSDIWMDPKKYIK